MHPISNATSVFGHVTSADCDGVPCVFFSQYCFCGSFCLVWPHLFFVDGLQFCQKLNVSTMSCLQLHEGRDMGKKCQRHNIIGSCRFKCAASLISNKGKHTVWVSDNVHCKILHSMFYKLRKNGVRASVV